MLTMSQTHASVPDSPLAELAAALRALRTQAGNPPYRSMAQKVNLSHTTLSRAATGKSLPTWDVIEAYVTACGGDPRDYRQLWEEASAKIRSSSHQISTARMDAQMITIDPMTARSVEEFLRMLRDARIVHGSPPYREIGKRSGRPVSTVADVFNVNRRKLPNLLIMESILRALGEDETLQRWRMAWMNLSAPVEHTPEDDGTRSLIRQANGIGLVGIYPNRGEALGSFVAPLEREIRIGGRLWIVGSSLKGFCTQTIGRIDGIKAVSRALRAGCDVRILCTHPTGADARAEQEGRKFGAIYLEISVSLANLKEAGLKRQNVRFSKSAPTVFGVCTSDHMLLNPYPYGNEAFLNFSMIVRKTFRDGIFARYLQDHFERSWASGEEVSEYKWNQHGGNSLEGHDRRSNR